jgi:hypothetical protein
MAQPPKNKREKFLPEEDRELRRLVRECGISSWETIAAGMPGRNPRQCRDRWKHYLSGDRAKVPWSAAEDGLLLEKMQTIGPRWTQLTAFFPGRTDMDVKARWMQTFASHSNLHIANRRIPVLQPVLVTPNPYPALLPGLPAQESFARVEQCPGR